MWCSDVSLNDDFTNEPSHGLPILISAKMAALQPSVTARLHGN